MGSRLTDDPDDPGLTHGPDTQSTEQAEVYLVLPESERALGYIRPYRDSYIHQECGALTRMSDEIAQTFARDPHFYGGTYCVGCRMHRPVAEFWWVDERGRDVLGRPRVGS